MSSLKYHKITQKLQVKSYELRVSMGKMFLRVLTVNCLLFSLLLCSSSPSVGAEITGPVVTLRDNEIHVTTALSLDETILQELHNGMTKEFRFYVDLYRVWKMWPDEFVLDKFFIRTLKCDPVKLEYIARSNDGTTLVQKRFKSFESMLQWALNINDLKLANIRELEPGVYYVRVTIESRIRKLPPVIGYFMIFLPETEFKISKKSSPIYVGNK
jgi:Domain of unknown function (DUF4390)